MRNVIPKEASLIPSNATCVFKGVIYDTYQWQQKLFDGSEKTFEMLRRPDTVKVIAVKDDKLVVLEQEQPNHAPFYDIPGGMHDNEQESELEAAKREMLEETGLTFKTWRLLEVTQPHNKIEQFVYIFFATDFESESEPHLDAGEKIEVRLLDLHDVKAMLDSPKNRYLPKEILNKVNNIEELVALPQYGS